jgi:hypothetical protein
MATWTGYHTAYRGGTRVEEITNLYTAKTTTDNGEWLDMAGVKSFNVQVDGITTGTVNLRMWNGATAPAATEHGELLKTALTADGTWTVDEHEVPRYAKVYISVSTTISLLVNVKRVRHVG